MNLNELQIGDYVRLDHRPYLVKELSMFDDKDIFGRVAVTGDLCNVREEIEPIRLSDDVLRDMFPDTEDGVFWCWDDFRSENLGENWFEVRIDNGEVDLTIGLRYVHELQHLLRLCGIEKEINLLKL